MLRAEDFNNVCRHFLRWDLFCYRAPAAPTCTSSPPANASHFAIGSDVSALFLEKMRCLSVKRGRKGLGSG